MNGGHESPPLVNGDLDYSVTVRLDSNLRRRLDKISKARNLSKGRLLRPVVEQFIMENADDDEF
jgi:predicted transcriptional regulator